VRKEVQLAFVGLFLGVAGTCIWLAGWDREPTYQRKSLTRWLLEEEKYSQLARSQKDPRVHARFAGDIDLWDPRASATRSMAPKSSAGLTLGLKWTNGPGLSRTTVRFLWESTAEHTAELYDPAMWTNTFALKRDAAHDAVRHIGTNGIPTLLRLVSAHDSAAKVWFLSLAGKQQVIRIQPGSTVFWNYLAGNALAGLGPGGVSAVSSLIEIYDHNFSPSSQFNALYALDHIDPFGPQTVRLLSRASANTNGFVRDHAVWRLRELPLRPQ